MGAGTSGERNKGRKVSSPRGVNHVERSDKTRGFVRSLLQSEKDSGTEFFRRDDPVH